MNTILDNLLEQHRSWIEASNHDLWVEEYNLKVAHQKNNDHEIALYTSKIKSIELMISKFHSVVKYIERNQK